MLPYFFVTLGALIILLSIGLGTCGSIIVWRHMSFFSDSLAHFLFFPIILSVLLNFDSDLINVLFSIVFVVIFLIISNTHHSTDSSLSFIAFTFMALAFFLASFSNHTNIDLISYLIGDILLVQKKDVILLLGIIVVIVAFIIKNWRNILLFIISNDLAKVKYRNSSLVNNVLLFLIAIFIAFAAKIVGILLISSLLVIPIMSARLIANNPQQTMVYSILFNIAIISLGVLASIKFNVYSSPSIVLIAVLLLLIILLLKKTILLKWSIAYQQ